MVEPLKPSCPVCKARFRGQSQCPRCGTDLSQLMQLLAHAHHLRSRARRALYEARYHQAHDLAAEAERLHHTPHGRKILLTAAALDRVSVKR